MWVPAVLLLCLVGIVESKGSSHSVIGSLTSRRGQGSRGSTSLGSSNSGMWLRDVHHRYAANHVWYNRPYPLYHTSRRYNRTYKAEEHEGCLQDPLGAPAATRAWIAAQILIENMPVIEGLEVDILRDLSWRAGCVDRPTQVLVNLVCMYADLPKPLVISESDADDPKVCTTSGSAETASLFERDGEKKSQKLFWPLRLFVRTQPIPPNKG
eukprot:TRINITY_DN2054_c0_g1_i5.p1 TRINITY_DN2054_c0_g1~~TRINITY_DN2054_c0_g1_i5.p1  ORF type:complete len:211 (+),score=21.53 TRINITY_DN2054_c0_g1_i5:37-669(+)